MSYRNIIILNQLFNFVPLKLQKFFTLYDFNEVLVYKFLRRLLQGLAVMRLRKVSHPKTVCRIKLLLQELRTRPFCPFLANKKIQYTVMKSFRGGFSGGSAGGSALPKSFLAPPGKIQLYVSTIIDLIALKFQVKGQV